VKVKDRNQHAQYLVKVKIERAKGLSEDYFSKLPEKMVVEALLRDLIWTKANGFRGVVLTSLVGLALNESYNPLEHFYACNPRSIFEQGIWYALAEYNIPCGKSDPLNVAKNINKIDEDWAEGKRPQSAAMAAVKFLRLYMNEQNVVNKKIMEEYFYFKLLEYATEVQGFQVSTVISGSFTRQGLAHKLLDFVLSAPESGATPQLLISQILSELFSDSSLVVEGGDESVFGTNTTSKKPADVWIEKESAVMLLFEITVKKIDLKRLDDCLLSCRASGVENVPITFICRIPEDVDSLAGLEKNTLNYKGRMVEFSDIREFVKSSFTLLNEDSIKRIIEKLYSFVQSVNVSTKTKNIWNSVFDC